MFAPTSVLIAFVSRAGSTAEVAEIVDQALLQHGPRLIFDL